MNFEKQIKRLEKKNEKEEKTGGYAAEALMDLYADDIEQIKKQRRQMKNAETRKRKAKETRRENKRKI